MPQGKRLTREQIRAVIRLFPNHTKKEIRNLTGVGLSSIDRIQMQYRLRKSAEHLHNMGVRAGKASNIARGGDSSSCYTPEAIAKRVASYKERYQMEDMRARWGLPQLTKMRLKSGPKHYHDQTSYLRHLGYIVDKEKKIAYYTADTHRATRLEKLKRGEKKGEFHCFYDFKPYDTHSR